MAELREKDWDNCECGHIRWQHVKQTCRAVDSYYCPCRCIGFEVDLGTIDAPEGIVAALSEVYKPDGVLIWLRARNRNLKGGRPVELCAAGREGEVRAEVERLVGGAW